MMEVKIKLQKARLKRGLSQEKIADMIGMTQSNYSRKENGSSKITQQEWERISKVLGIPLDEIFENDESHIFIFQDNATGNYGGTNNIFSIPKHIEELLETQKKYIERLEEEIKSLKS